MFHCLALQSANLLVGGVGAQRSNPAWQQVYRALEHNEAKKKCLANDMLKRFPKEIEDFANTFVNLQIKRHSADYDPVPMFHKSEVTQDIADATDVIKRLNTVPALDRRAFSAYILFKRRP